MARNVQAEGEAMNGEQKPLEKTLSLMGMDILDDETRKKLNGMMAASDTGGRHGNGPRQVYGRERPHVLLRGRVALQPLGGLERALCRGRGHGRVVGRVHLV